MTFDFNNKNVLITGGAGFIGSNIAFYLQRNYPLCHITVFDKFQSDDKFPSGNYTAFGHFKNLEGFKGKVISGDINDANDQEVLKNYSWDCIFHEAAISDTTVMNQSLVIKTNTNTLQFFIKLASQSGAHLVYASSAGTYGNSIAPNKVGAGEIPENVYGFSKLMMDNAVRELLKSNPEAKVTGLRYFNVYGPLEYYKAKTASMILQLGLQMLSTKKVRLFKYGEQMRDFVFVADVVQANIKAIGSKPGIYNVGYGKARTFNDIIKILTEVLEVKTDIEYIDNPYIFYQNNTCADITETQKHLQYNPEFSLEKGIAAYKDEIIRINNIL